MFKKGKWIEVYGHGSIEVRTDEEETFIHLKKSRPKMCAVCRYFKVYEYKNLTITSCNKNIIKCPQKYDYCSRGGLYDSYTW